jgi:hypothetical protein
MTRSTRPGPRRLALIAGLGALALLSAGCASSISGTGGFAGASGTDGPVPSSSGRTPTSSTTSKSGTTSTSPSPSKSHDFPTTSPTATRSSTSTPQPGTSTPASSGTKAAIASTGEQWLHAYGNSDEATFCALSDPLSLTALLASKDIPSCDELVITWDTDLDLQAELQAFAIPDPSKITITGSTAVIDGEYTTPSDLGLPELTWYLESDGTWKADCSIFSN